MVFIKDFKSSINNEDGENRQTKKRKIDDDEEVSIAGCSRDYKRRIEELESELKEEREISQVIEKKVLATGSLMEKIISAAYIAKYFN